MTIYNMCCGRPKKCPTLVIEPKTKVGRKWTKIIGYKYAIVDGETEIKFTKKELQKLKNTLNEVL